MFFFAAHEAVQNEAVHNAKVDMQFKLFCQACIMVEGKFAKELKKTIYDNMTFDPGHYGGR